MTQSEHRPLELAAATRTGAGGPDLTSREVIRACFEGRLDPAGWRLVVSVETRQLYVALLPSSAEPAAASSKGVAEFADADDEGGA
jgi:hypothetical protein